MTQFWDNRYSTRQFVYGKEPNHFFSSELKKISPGSILLPGEGEGRNAIYAARTGWTVDAFDQSRQGYQKAIAYALDLDLQINYDVCRLGDFKFKPGHYDVVALINFHAGRPETEYLHRKVCESLKPGGRVILEAFHKEQLGNDSGGPGSLEMLFDENMIQSDFEGLDPLLLEKSRTSMNEGCSHQGEAIIIRYTDIKSK